MTRLHAIKITLFFFCYAFPNTYHIPHVPEVRIDGSLADWRNLGFETEVLSSSENFPAVKDFRVRFKMGWSEKGLLFAFQIEDDFSVRAENPAKLYLGDALEILVSDAVGSPSFSKWMFSWSGSSPTDSSWFYAAYRTPKDRPAWKHKPQFQVKQHSPHTATLECLLPWSPPQGIPKVGTQIGVQIFFNDQDTPGQPRQNRLLFYPSTEWLNTHHMHVITLDHRPSPPQDLLVKTGYDGFGNVSVTAHGGKKKVGGVLDLSFCGNTLSTPFASSDREFARARAQFPLPKTQSTCTLTVRHDGREFFAHTYEDLQREKLRVLLQSVSFGVAEPVFYADRFPVPTFDNPTLAHQLLGPYTVTNQFFDAEYRPVSKASQLGRYGIVSTIRPAEGTPLRRYTTLYRAKQEVSYPYLQLNSLESIQDHLGLPKKGESVERFRMAHALLPFLHVNRLDGEQPAALLAAMREPIGANEPYPLHLVGVREEFWWLGLRRKLDGSADLYRKKIAGPKRVSKTAPELCPGSPGSAGFSVAGIQKIDSLLQAWWDSSGTPFSVSIARNGVKVLQKGYGRKNGKVVDGNTPFWLASLTKLLTGVQTLFLVDQVGLSPDDPVAKYLPSFRNRVSNQPLRIRHLFSHTHGLSWSGGLYGNDFLEKTAEMVSLSTIGKQYRYSGLGYNLAKAVIENVSGEPLFQFGLHRLLQPMGCTNTLFTNGSGNGLSSAADMAKIGQMLLNEGAYGPWSFFSRESFRHLLPVSLASFGASGKSAYGLGTITFNRDRIGEGAYGHGSASKIIFRVSPAKNLVVVLMRDEKGVAYDFFAKAFLTAVREAML